MVCCIAGKAADLGSCYPTLNVRRGERLGWGTHADVVCPGPQTRESGPPELELESRGLLFRYVLCAELLELGEGGGGLAGVDGFGAEGNSFFEIAGEAGGDEDGSGVE